MATPKTGSGVTLDDVMKDMRKRRAHVENDDLVEMGNDVLLRKELMDIVDEISQIPFKARPTRNKRLKELLKSATKTTHQFVHMVMVRETQHIFLMARILEKVQEFMYTEKHDHTKDTLYIFVTGIYFTAFKNIGEKPNNLQKMFSTETNRHYALEPHHPQYEMFRNEHGEKNAQCTRKDILEMALDRMARNVQMAPKHMLSPDNVMLYKPEFEYNNSQKQRLFASFVYDPEYVRLVQDTWNETFPQSVEHSPTVTGGSRKRGR